MTLPPSPADIRTFRIRTAPDWALRQDTTYPYTDNYAAIWAAQEGIDPAPTADEVKAELQRRADSETLNRVNLASVLASREDEPFIPSRDMRALESFIGWLWTKDERRMHMTLSDLRAERIRRGLPTDL